MIEQQFSYLDQYKIIKTLGSGYYSKVKLAQSPNHQLVAIKRFKSQTTNLESLQKQFTILSDLHHENLINLIDVRPDATYKKKGGIIYTCFVIITQYAAGGQLFDFIALAGRFSPCVTRTYFRQMMNGINYMHNKGYAHRDIKPENLLLTGDFTLKLADFGFSTLLQGKDHSGILHTRLGTQGYIAPQIQSRNYIGTQVDIFSSGVILFIMYTATPPFQKSIPNDPKYSLIIQKKYEQFWQLHEKRRFEGFFSDQFKDLVEKMLEYNPKQRITLQQISKHPWTNGDIYSKQQIKKQFKIRKQKVDAQLKRQKQQRQQKKRQRQNILSGMQTYSMQQNSEISTFVQHYNKQTLTDRNIPVKQKIQKGDYIVKENEDYFFSSILTLLNNRIHINDQENQINFHPKCTVKQNKLDITLAYKYQHFEYNLLMEIYVTKTLNNDLCLTFKRVSGNLLYYKKILNFIRLKFNHHEVHPTNL